MNRGLIQKSIREVLPITLLFGSILLVVETVLSYALPAFQNQFSEQILQIPFVRNIIQAMVGVEAGDRIGLEMIHAVAWVHPVVLSLVWAHAIVCCTRIPAGEIDRGSIDLLVGLPVSRWELHLSETVVWVSSAVAIVVVILLGNGIGSSWLPGGMRPDPGRRWIVAANLLGLQLAAGSLAWLASALSDRRGRAVTIAFVLLLVSFLMNYLRPFWEPIESVAFLSLLSYYEPMFILRDGVWPVADMAVLFGAALVLWTAAGAVFDRRDLCSL